MKKSFIGVLITDFMIILAPFIIQYDSEVFGYINTFLIIVLLLSLVLAMLSKDFIKTVMNDRKKNHKYYWIYDCSTDLAVVVTWSYFGLYLVPILLVFNKAVTLVNSNE